MSDEFKFVNDQSLKRMLNTQIMVQSWCELHRQYRELVESRECQEIGFMQIIKVAEIEALSKRATEMRATFLAEVKARSLDRD
jgi:hypothetical protein